MRTSAGLILSVLLSVSTLACDKGGDKKDDKKADDKKADDKKAEGDKAEGDKAEGDKAEGDKADEAAAGDAAAAGEITLPKIGLKADAPAGTSVSEMMGNDMVQGPNLVATVEKGDEKPKTGEEAQADADIYTPKDPKIETLPDGYVLTFTNEGGAGTNFFVNVRREIDGAAYWCSTMSSTQEQSDATVAFCKSLRK